MITARQGPRRALRAVGGAGTLVTDGGVSRIGYAPVPFLPALPALPTTIAYTVATYLIASLLLSGAVRAGRALIAAGQPPGWIGAFMWVDRSLRQDDGRWPLALSASALR